MSFSAYSHLVSFLNAGSVVKKTKTEGVIT